MAAAGAPAKQQPVGAESGAPPRGSVGGRYRPWYHVRVPPKIRELESQLRKAGFVKQAARGSHRKWVHPSGKLVVMSGREGDDAKKYQQQVVEEAVAAAEKHRKS